MVCGLLFRDYEGAVGGSQRTHAEICCWFLLSSSYLRLLVVAQDQFRGGPALPGQHASVEDQGHDAKEDETQVRDGAVQKGNGDGILPGQSQHQQAHDSGLDDAQPPRSEGNCGQEGVGDGDEHDETDADVETRRLDDEVEAGHFGEPSQQTEEDHQR